MSLCFLLQFPHNKCLGSPNVPPSVPPGDGQISSSDRTGEFFFFSFCWPLRINCAVLQKPSSEAFLSLHALQIPNLSSWSAFRRSCCRSSARLGGPAGLRGASADGCERQTKVHRARAVSLSSWPCVQLVVPLFARPWGPRLF